ncbi:MAG: SPASM domain-containing protein [Candidatus Eremiobacteraeota bacterium]|nr:SPASM domain-containing protein [Candidatus Eremiobacteraeota bacterium]
MARYLIRPSPVLEKMRSRIERVLPGIYHALLERQVRKEDRKYRKAIRDKIDSILAVEPFPLFDSVELETLNRCNNTCSFCPVNARDDRREYRLMDEGLFRGIIGQLQGLDYRGALALYSNNEPLLDKRILEFHRAARAALPKARINLCTNGILLTRDSFLELAELLDELIIDNYDDRLSLIRPLVEIQQLIEGTPELQQKVKIFIRRKNAIRKTRGGEARNRRRLTSALRSSCALPFTQLVIRPDGKVSLCCQDALGKVTLGDASKDALEAIWRGEAYRVARTALLEGRSALELCSQCDHFVC